MNIYEIQLKKDNLKTSSLYITFWTRLQEDEVAGFNIQIKLKSLGNENYWGYNKSYKETSYISSYISRSR